ncbi:hypothetical protein D3C76_977430 [compost metagenome]
MGLLGDDLVAGAVVAEALAERDVNVDRQLLGRRPVAPRDGLPVVVHGKGLVELWGGRIRGIARAGPIVFLDQGAIEAQRLSHPGYLLRCLGGEQAGFLPAAGTRLLILMKIPLSRRSG